MFCNTVPCILVIVAAYIPALQIPASAFPTCSSAADHSLRLRTATLDTQETQRMPAWPERTDLCPDTIHESTAAEFHRAMLCLWTDAVRAYRVTTYTLWHL